MKGSHESPKEADVSGRLHAVSSPLAPPEAAEDVARQSIEADQTGSISRRERLARLDRALAGIQLEKRAVLVLYEIEEQTAPEIARALGISVNTVYSRLRVARAELELALKRDL